MRKFTPICLEKQLCIPENPTHAHVAVISLWTVKEKMAVQFADAGIVPAVIGQLYSLTRGIFPLVKNLLANEQITHLCVTGEDLSGSCLRLFSFFDDLERLDTIVRTDGAYEVFSAQFYEQYGIPKEVLLRELLTLVRVTTVPVPTLVVDDIEFVKAQLVGGLECRARVILPEYSVPSTACAIPVQASGAVIRSNTIEDAWIRVLAYLQRYGSVSNTHYGQRQQEIYNMTVVVHNQPVQPIVGECVSVLEELPVVYTAFEDLNRIYSDWLPVKGLTTYANGLWEGEKFPNVKYTYGSRMRHGGTPAGECDQIEAVITKLLADADQRSATMVLFTPADAAITSGTPCLDLVSFRCTQGLLHMTMVLRSNDMFSAWVMDFAGFRNLQYRVLDELKARDATGFWSAIKIGDTISQSLSAHIYEDCWEWAKQVVEQHPVKREYADRFGNWLVGEKDVQLLECGTGHVLRSIKYADYENLSELLVEVGKYVENAQHALYLGTELMCALIAGDEYIQDYCSGEEFIAATI